MTPFQEEKFHKFSDTDSTIHHIILDDSTIFFFCFIEINSFLFLFWICFQEYEKKEENLCAVVNRFMRLLMNVLDELLEFFLLWYFLFVILMGCEWLGFIFFWYSLDWEAKGIFIIKYLNIFNTPSSYGIKNMRKNSKMS